MVRPCPVVAVVEEELAIGELLCELLMEEGYRVICCRNDDNVSDTIQREQPALVLLDLQLVLPHRGWSILRKLRQDAATRSIPVIGLTTEIQMAPEQVHELHQLNCNLLRKPFDLGDLLKQVERATGTCDGTA